MSTTPRIEQADPVDLEPSEHHVRGETAVDDRLVQSVKAVGVVETPIGRIEDGEVRILDGMRRVVAAREAGLETVSVFVREFTDADALAATLTLNSGLQAFDKDVTDSDREHSLRRVGDGDQREGERRAGLITERDRIHTALEGCRGVGPKTIDELADAFGTCEELEATTQFDLETVPGVGESTARGIREWLDRDDGEVVVHR